MKMCVFYYAEYFRDVNTSSLGHYTVATPYPNVGIFALLHPLRRHLSRRSGDVRLAPLERR